MTDYVCVPNSQYKGPGFGGGPGSNCTMVDARVVYAEMYRARTLLRGPGDINAYLSDSIVGAGVNQFIANIASKEAFAKYATDFEKAFSVLTKPKRPLGYVSAYPEYRADPVIDKERLIVGHFGWFPGDSIWVDNSAPRSRGQGELYIEVGLQEILSSGAPVHIGRRNTNSYRWATGDEKLHLLTDIDGRVLQYTNYDLVGLESADNVLMVIGLVYSVGALATAGVKAGIRSLVRTFAKDASKASFARPLLKGIIHGQPPGVRVGDYNRLGCLYGQVNVGDEGVTYVVKAIILKGKGTPKQMADVATARVAHREMIMRAAEIARSKGQKEFRFLGTEASNDFRAHASRLAQEVGKPTSARAVEGSSADADYEVILDVAKVLAQQ